MSNEVVKVEHKAPGDAGGYLTALEKAQSQELDSAFSRDLARDAANIATRRILLLDHESAPFLIVKLPLDVVAVLYRERHVKFAIGAPLRVPVRPWQQQTAEDFQLLHIISHLAMFERRPDLVLKLERKPDTDLLNSMIPPNEKQAVELARFLVERCRK